MQVSITPVGVQVRQGSTCLSQCPHPHYCLSLHSFSQTPIARQVEEAYVNLSLLANGQIKSWTDHHFGW